MFAWILNTKPVSLSSVGFDLRAARLARGSGAGACTREVREQLLDAEVADRRAEEHRRLPAGEIGLHVEFGGAAAHQLDFVAKCIGAIAEELAAFRAVQALDRRDWCRARRAPAAS